MPPCSSSTLAQISAVLPSFHTIDRCKGAPVERSQAIVDSRWLVIPSATTLGGFDDAADDEEVKLERDAALAAATAPPAQRATEDRISMGSCSTQLFRGGGRERRRE